MIYGGHRTLSPHPRPLRRKTSALDGYYKNGIPVTTMQVGETVTYDVPGAPRQVYLVQTVNGVQSFNGPYSLPMAPYTLNVNDRPGTYVNMVYDKSPSSGGVLLESDSATLLPAPASPYTQPSATPTPTLVPCPTGFVRTSSGGCYPEGPVPAPATAVTTPTQTAQPTIRTTTTTSTSSTGGGASGGGGLVSAAGSGGTGPFTPPPVDNTLLYVGLAALAFALLS